LPQKEQRGLSVGRSVCHDREPCKNGRTDPDVVWAAELGGPKEPFIRWGLFKTSIVNDMMK